MADFIPLDQVSAAPQHDAGFIPFDQIAAPSRLRGLVTEPPTSVPGGWVGRQVAGAAAGAGAGFGRTVLGGQELVGEGLKALGLSGPADWLIADARTGAERLRAQEAPYREAAPTAALVGEMVGATPIPAGVGARLALGARPLLGAMATGAAAGALDPTSGQNFLREKAIQMGLGAAGGGIVHGVGTAAAGLIGPRLSPAANTLAQAGVRLTPGQMADGAGRRVEDALASVPGVGVMIRGAQRQGVEDFNRAALDEALAPIGGKIGPKVAAGRDAIGDAQRQTSAFYDKLLKGARFKVDAQFATDVANLKGMVKALPDQQAAQFDAILNQRVGKRLSPTGTMDGETFKDVESELTNLANRYRRSPMAGEKDLGDALDELKHQLRDGLERSNPGIAPELAKANRAYAMLSRVEDASMRRGTADGIFTPADLLGAVRGDARRTGRRKSFARGDALMQGLAEAAQGVLPQRVPDSGTPERLATMGLLGLGEMSHYLNPWTLAGIGAAALPYTRPALAAANRLAQPPGPVRNALAQGIRQGTSYLVPGAAQAAQIAAGQVP